MRACAGLQPVVRRCEAGLEIIFLFKRPAPELADVSAGRFRAFRHADHQSLRARVQRHRDRPAADAPGAARRPHAAARLRDLPRHRVSRTPTSMVRTQRLPALFSLGQNRGSGWVYSTERRPRRPTEDERRAGRDPHLLHRRRRVPRRLAARPDSEPQADRPSARHRGALHQPRPADPRRHADADAGERRSGGIDQAAGRLAAAARGNGGGTAERRRKASRGPTNWPGGWCRSSRSISSASPRKGAAPIRCTRCSTSMPIAAIRAWRAMCARSRASNRGRWSSGCRSPDRCVSGAAPR